MDAPAGFAASNGDGPDLNGSLPRWERWLLALELGSAGVDPGPANRRDRPVSRSARDWMVDSMLFAFAVLAAASVTITHHARLSTAMVVLNAALAAPARADRPHGPGRTATMTGQAPETPFLTAGAAGNAPAAAGAPT